MAFDKIIDMAIADKNSSRLEAIPMRSAPRRKISRAEWPAIGTRYAKGESLASIARDYRCTPPAIRYIVRTERQQGGPEYPESPSENRAPDGIITNDATAVPSTLERDHLAQLANSVPPTGPTSRPYSGAKTDKFDVSLRDGMTLEISGLLVAFDAVVAEATPEAINQLRKAADRLLRATARIRIELERSPWHSLGRPNT